MTGPSTRTSLHWQDIVILVIAVWLFASPAILGYGPDNAATWSALAAGAVLAILSLASMFLFRVWEEWLTTLIGIVAIVLPWVAGFSADRTAMPNFVVCGIAAAVLAGWRIRIAGHERATAARA